MIPAHDIWIAALAAQHNLLLFSRDNHFEHLPQIPRV
jgi:predicted nucleic acid-binding protein